MPIIDRGSGTPIVVVPGVQGRWEYAGPAIEALARSFRVITFPLCGERGCPPFEPSNGMDNFSDQIAAALDACQVERAIICGISFGGLAALRFAAEHPNRTDGLVLVSTPGPGWRLKKRHRLYARAPWIFGPLFLAETPRRVRREIAAAIPRRRDRIRFAWRQLRAFVAAPIAFARMAERAALISTVDFAADAARVAAPTLVVSGEPRLDYVVPPDGTCQYGRLIAGARTVRLDGTGHLGSITKPDRFASVVRDFVVNIDRVEAPRPVLNTREHSACGSSERASASEPSGGGAPRALENGASASSSDSLEPLRGAQPPSNRAGGGAPARVEEGGAPRESKNDAA